MVKVGKYDKKKVTELNNELYREAVEIIFNSDYSRYGGKVSLSKFIDWLEENYNVSKRDTK